jgi:methylmalonyl-CoA mutase N-terminal domain/subunit
VAFHPYSEENAVRQIERLRKIKAERDSSRVSRALERVRRDATGNLNLMPAVIEAVKAYATVGEITATLKEVYGEYQEPVYF